MSKANEALYSGFLATANLSPHRIALEVNSHQVSYGELRERAASIAATLQARSVSEEPPLTAVFAHRSLTAFSGILAVLMRGHGYVPLNRTFPLERTLSMLRLSGCRALVVDEESAAQLDEILSRLDGPVLVILPDMPDVTPIAEKHPSHVIVGACGLVAPQHWEPHPVDPCSIVYLLFTSGSTGVPKGVMVSHANMTHFIRVMIDRFGFTAEDRFSQANDLTFDVSTFDIFVPWEVGATVCCLPQRVLLQPDRFIREKALTVWYAGPSVAIRMRKLGALTAGRFDQLRYTFFAGEPLPVEIARVWQIAAPNSIIENLYGPTELTVTCTAYRFDAQKTPAESEVGWVPIGEANSGLHAIIADENLCEVATGQEGELLVGGPQVALGYLHDPEKTAAAFVRPPGQNGLYYRTGDRVRRSPTGGPLLFLGRRDLQVQIHGYRVELGEVEAALREESGCDEVVALGWPVTPSGVGGIVAFVGNQEVDVHSIQAKLKSRLPDYMIPRTIHTMSSLPLNANRKVDRGALLKALDGKTTKQFCKMAQRPEPERNVSAVLPWV